MGEIGGISENGEKAGDFVRGFIRLATEVRRVSMRYSFWDVAVLTGGDEMKETEEMPRYC